MPNQWFGGQHLRVDVDHAGIDHLPTRKGQQLPGERRGPLPRVFDLCQTRHEFVFRRMARCHILEQLGVRQDDGQQVVEVVSHTTGQTTKAFHLLGFNQPRFQPHPAGDIKGQTGHQIDRAVGTANRKLQVLDPDLLAIRADDPVFDLESG